MDSSPHAARILNSNPNSPYSQYSYSLSNSKSMATAIVVLFIVLLLALAFHIYAKWFMRQNIRGADGHQSNGRSTGAAGLDKMAIDSLPVFTYTVKKSPIESRDSNSKTKDGDKQFGATGIVAPECAVCLSEFAEGEKGRLLPQCNHSFHTECIDMWFHSHSTCPLCRTPVMAAAGTSVTGFDESGERTILTNDTAAPTLTISDMEQRQQQVSSPQTTAITASSSSSSSSKPSSSTSVSHVAIDVT